MRVNKLKIVVFGSYNAGKTSYIQAIDPEARHIEACEMTNPTTVALDFGRVSIGERKVYLYGTPGQERFGFVRQILSRGMDGAIVMVDTTRDIDEMTLNICHTLKGGGVPYAIFLNKCDHVDSCPDRFKVMSDEEYVFHISARTKENTFEALESFISGFALPLPN